MRLPRTITATLTIIIMMPCIYCLYFHTKRVVIQHQMEQRLESASLQTVIIPVKDFRWYEEDREIIVEGMMFDVKSIREHNGNYIVTGLFDEAETRLNITMGRMQEKRSNGTDEKTILAMLSQTLIHFTDEDGVPEFPAPAIVGSKLHCPDEMLYNTFLSIQTPPPRA